MLPNLFVFWPVFQDQPQRMKFVGDGLGNAATWAAMGGVGPLSLTTAVMWRRSGKDM